MFDKNKAEEHLQKLLRKYKITVYRWSRSSSGHAVINERKIKIPPLMDTDTFCVAMHEVKHIIDGNKGKRYEQEFACDMYARQQALSLGFDVTEWDKRTVRHCLVRIAMAHNRGLKKINPNIKRWFSDVNFSEWKNKKVFVARDNSQKGYTISFYEGTYEF